MELKRWKTKQETERPSKISQSRKLLSLLGLEGQREDRLPSGIWEHGRKALSWYLGHEEDAVTDRDAAQSTAREKFPGFPLFLALSLPASEPLCEPETCWQGSLGNVVCMVSKAGEGWEREVRAKRQMTSGGAVWSCCLMSFELSFTNENIIPTS